eukprot:Opistho-1_new@77389
MAQQGDPLAEVIEKIGKVESKIEALEERIEPLEKKPLDERNEDEKEELKRLSARINEKTELLISLREEKNRLSAAAANSAGASTTGKRPADSYADGDRMPKKFKGTSKLQAAASAVLSRLAATNIAVYDLFDPEKVTRMPFPSADLLPVRFGPGGGYFDFMGREPLEPLLDLMRTLSRGSKIPI